MWSVLIVGLGQIGMGYDLQSDPSQFVLTHARGFQQHPDFRLAGGVDINPKNLDLFRQSYGCNSYPDLEEALAKEEPDLVVVATPTQYHYQVIRTILSRIKPLAIICEKPIDYDIQKASEIVSSCFNLGVRLYVNYMRRSDCGALEIKRRIQNHQILAPARGVTWYSKGILNNGSHFLNLLQYWLGPVRDIRLINQGRLWDNFDPEPDIQVDFALGNVIFLAVQEENYSHSVVELVVPNGRLRYEQGGASIQWQAAMIDPIWAGYRTLSSTSESIFCDLNRSQWHFCDQLSRDLRGASAEICSGNEALETLKVLQKIIQA